jgi:hypothetical protein
VGSRKGVAEWRGSGPGNSYRKIKVGQSCYASSCSDWRIALALPRGRARAFVSGGGPSSWPSPPQAAQRSPRAGVGLNLSLSGSASACAPFCRRPVAGRSRAPLKASASCRRNGRARRGAHGTYLAREGAERECAKGRGFDAERETWTSRRRYADGRSRRSAAVGAFVDRKSDTDRIAVDADFRARDALRRSETLCIRPFASMCGSARAFSPSRRA